MNTVLAKPARTVTGGTFRVYLGAWTAESDMLARYRIAREASQLAMWLYQETRCEIYWHVVLEWDDRAEGRRHE